MVSIAFVSSAYNEEGNLREFYRRCKSACEELNRLSGDIERFEFNLIVADNGSTDKTLKVLEEIRKSDASVVAISNIENYGAEASNSNLMKIAEHYDYIIMLCSDLQDPPELAISMIMSLQDNSNNDAVLAIKRKKAKDFTTRIAKSFYYAILGATTRRNIVPSGFHGFGCYSRMCLERANTLWEHSDLNLRQCLYNACNRPLKVLYDQPERTNGRSSYGAIKYCTEGIKAIISNDATASRTSAALSYITLAGSLLAGILILVNVLSGHSKYLAGTPTIMGLILITSAVQLVMISLLARQIESIKQGGLRKNVIWEHVGVNRK